MGKFGRAIAAGVHSGLTTLGAGLQQQAAEERADERLDKEDAFKERQLSIQEKDAELRAQAAEQQKILGNAKINHAKLAKHLAGAGNNLTLQAEAITNFFPDKRIYRFNDSRAAELKAWGVMDISFLDKDKITGEIQMDDRTGEPKEIQSRAPTNEIIFETQGDYEKFKAGISSPELYFAYALQDIDTEEAIRRSNAMSDSIIGKADLELKKQQAEKAKQQAEKAKQDAALAKRTEAGKKGSNLDKIREQGFNQFAGKLAAELGVAVSPDTAKKIAAISDNAKIRDKFLTGVKQALDPKDPTTRADFIESGVTEGLPREFMERMYGEFERGYEERADESAALSDGWFKSMYDSVLGFFVD